MTDATRLHKRAMELADKALLARVEGDADKVKILLTEAFENERHAASLVAGELAFEPTRSVLHRSAASLALECGETREAERLIGTALAGSPPDAIADELRDLLEQVYFQRHLDLRGITLHPSELQISLEGESVGFGIAPSDKFVTRVKDFETILYRTAERKLGHSFRERGSTGKGLKKDLEVFVSVPRVSSFAITLRVGSSGQIALPGLDLTQEIIDETLECLDLFSASKTETLQQRFGDEAYYRNFIGLAKRIAPDGRDIKTVGFTALKGEKERRVVLSSRLDQLQQPSLRVTEDTTREIKISGTLKFANSLRLRSGLIQIVDNQGVPHKIQVPPGLMGDIVRPMYEQEVVVTGQLKANVVVLDTIVPAEAEEE